MFIRTLTGDIAPEELGVCDSHEHLIRSGGEETRDPDFVMDSVEAAKKEVGYWLAAGGRAMVLMDSLGCGRNVPKILEVAEAYRGKANLILTTGFHKADFYDVPVHWMTTVREIDTCVDLLAAEVEEGLDIHSYNGPVVQRVDARAGIIKAGTSYGAIQAFEYKTLRAAALTQQRTGCPISVHTQLGTMAYETANLLREYGADLSHVMLCHVHKNPDKYYHKKIMETGVSICYDGPDRAKYFPDALYAENLKWLVDQGFQKQILLSMDAGRASYQRGYMEEKDRTVLGVSYLLERFVPLLREVGVPDDAINDMLVNNPARVLTFRQ